MLYNVKNQFPQWDFEIIGASYAGNPKDYTIMYITKKVSHLVSCLRDHKGCLCFLENGINVPKELTEKNKFIFSENPQLEYAKFAQIFEKIQRVEDKKREYHLMEGGYYIGENVSIGRDAYVEPGVLIGHDVIIGDNACIRAGSVIKKAIIGNDFLCNEKAVIGADGFTMTEDAVGNKIRIPTLGKVFIGNQVEIGVHDNISCGSAGDTVIEDYVKIDALVHVGHDAHLCRNVEITAGGIVGGYSKVCTSSYMGINVSLKNRIIIGENAVIGMGAVVTKSIEADTTVVGNPARELVK